MPDLPLPPIFAYVATKAKEHPIFLADALASYREAHSLTEIELAERLGISLDNLHLLALCRKPEKSEQLEQIAIHFSLDSQKLAEITGTTL